jgi:pimeloyl-ACP methyl ester carboxylesterase
MNWRETVDSLLKTMVALGVIIAGTQQLYAAQDSHWSDPSPHTVQFVSVAQAVQLEVLDWGGTGVPIVLLAGSGLSAHVYDQFAPALTDAGHVYGITRRGYGNSSHPTTGYDNQQLAGDVLEVLEKLRLDRPILVGHSMAGSELTTIGSEHSDRIRGLIYLDALGDPRDMEASDRRFRQALQKLPSTGKAPPLPEEARSFSGFREWQLRSDKFALPESELRTIFATNPDGSMGKPVAFNGANGAVFAGEMKRDYSGIRVPVLAILEFPRFEPQADYHAKTEEEFERIFEVSILHAIYVFRWIDNLKRSVPDARIVNVPDSGHYLFLTKPAEVARQIRKFVSANAGG